MTWAIVHGDASWADLEHLTSRAVVDDLLAEWVTSGPPVDRRRIPFGVTLFEHHIDGRIAVMYFVDEHQRLVGIMRIRQF